MQGPEDDPGITFRVLQELFHIRAERSHGFRYTISVQMLEIFNNDIVDLLAPASQIKKDFKIQDGGGPVQIVPALTELPCDDEQSILNAIALGQRHRGTYQWTENRIA